MPSAVFTDANHICIVTADIDRAVRVWSDKYGVGPWQVFSYDSSTMTALVNGEPTAFAMRAALCQLGPHFRVEIIQPVGGGSPYAESLGRHQGADHVHHVRLDVADYGSAIEWLRGSGLATRMDMTFQNASPDGPGLTATYLGTEDDLGFILEIAHRPPGFTMPEPNYICPASDPV